MMKPTPVDMPGLTNARILALVVGDITCITLALGFLTKLKKNSTSFLSSRLRHVACERCALNIANTISLTAMIIHR